MSFITKGVARPISALHLAAASLVLVILLLCVAVLWILLPVLSDPVPGFAARKGELLSFEVTSLRELADSRLSEIALTSTSGLKVELALRQPHIPLPTKPILVVIAGLEAGRDAVMMFPTTHGVTVAALSYPYEGSREFSRLALALDLHKVQRAIVDTPPAVMLANDYLLQQADLDSENLELVGVSFGAFLAAVPAALDPRVQRVWLIHGAGDPARVIDGGLEKNIPLAPLRLLVAKFLAAAVGSHYLSSEEWVGRVAPRPVMVINGCTDDDLPREAVKVLHDALQMPYEVMWTKGGHIHPKRPETIIEVIELMFQRVVQDASL